MAYRTDEQRLRLRVAELEGELAQARARIARLEGREPAAPFARVLFGTEVDVRAQRTTHGTVDWEITNVLDGIATDRGWASGVIDRSGDRLIWTTGKRSRMVRISIAGRSDELSIRAHEGMENLLGTAYGVGSAIAVVLLAFVVVLGEGTGLPFEIAAGTGALTVLVVLVAARIWVGSIASRRRRELDDVVEHLSRALEAHDTIRFAEAPPPPPAASSDQTEQAEREASITDPPRPRASTARR